MDLTRGEFSEENGEHKVTLKVVKPKTSKTKKPRRYKRVLLYAASVLGILFIANLFTSDSKFKNYQAELISSDGVKIMMNDFYRGFKAGLAGIKFGQIRNGEPIYIAADERKASKDKQYELITPREESLYFNSGRNPGLDECRNHY